MLNHSFSRHTTQLLLAVTVLFCFARAIYTYRNLDVNNLYDFYVYDTASALVGHHENADLYDGADRGIDPQFLFNDPASVFAGRARALGVPRVRMYVYPPLLADLLLPLSWMEAHKAGYTWLLLNGGALLLSALLLTGIVDVPWCSWAAATTLAGLLGMFSVALALETGQITIMLLLLWVLAMAAHRRGWDGLSAGAIALAVCIKLTPLIAVLPFLIWGNWRWISRFAACLAGLAIVMLVVNGPAPLLDYFLHVMPAMSRGIPHLENRSLAAGLQILYRALHGGSFVALQATGPGPIPGWLLLLGKGLPLCLLAITAGWLALRTRHVAKDDQVLIVAAFALFSVIVSPVSWFHGFVVAFPVLVLLWARALRHTWPRWQALLLTLCSLDLGAALVNGLRQRTGNTVAAALLTLVTPLVVLLVVALGLSQAVQRPQAQHLQA